MRTLIGLLGLFGCWMLGTMRVPAQDIEGLVPRFERPTGRLVLTRPTQAGAFLDVVGRRAALLGYEHRAFEVWVYPLKILRDLRLSFQIADYPIPLSGEETLAFIEVRPEATVLTYSHAAFTVRQILYAPLHEPGIVMLFDVQAVRPLTIRVAFRPDLRLMWPAGLMTGYLGWNEEVRCYTITEETRRFAGVIGSPLARDLSVQPYQEEPKDLPNQFELEVTPELAARYYIPVVITGSVEGIDDAIAAYRRLLDQAASYYHQNVAHYERLLDTALQLETPDPALNTAYAWALVGIDKGLATNPYLGTGLVAGFRTAGNSERPGFAWFFGRDALWTVLATTAVGHFETTRIALDFLRKFQRADGKIPHEISQSAALIDWFKNYPYPWASADATPLFIVAHADYWQTSGDLDYIRQHWTSLVRAYRFTAATDTDGNDLVENTDVGHGWVEGGQLYPPHEELYQQGVWLAALEGMAAMATALGKTELATEVRQQMLKVRAAVERTYWLDDKGFYAFATWRPDGAGPSELLPENTVLQAVPLWWRLLHPERARRALEHVGSAEMATDWGTRILSSASSRYDPLSYHHGSVWPLFTGWASMAAYRYEKPHIGYQALMANVLLTYQGALGYVTELLSGAFNRDFGRSSYHQIWSEAMVVTPLVRGLLGLEVREGGRVLRLAPQLPATWDSLQLRHVPVGSDRYAIRIRRTAEAFQIQITPEGRAAPISLDLAPAFPLDAQVEAVTVNEQPAVFEVREEGDLQRVRIRIPIVGPTTIRYRMQPGTDVYVAPEPLVPGMANQGLRVLRVRAEAGHLLLVLEGRVGRTYTLQVRTPRRLWAIEGVQLEPAPDGYRLHVRMGEEGTGYVRRVLRLPLQ
ncbi:MAG: GH116 family glycosyl hydrolase [Rhodothermus sp.]|nr:GH116 family glycosyl hydrolase [Rhodothermus sp.]